MSLRDVEAAGGMTRAARLAEQEGLRVLAEDLTREYGVPVYPARRRGEDGLSAEVGRLSVSGPADEVREWLAEHAARKAPASPQAVLSAAAATIGDMPGDLIGRARSRVQEARRQRGVLKAPAGGAGPEAPPAGQD